MNTQVSQVATRLSETETVSDYDNRTSISIFSGTIPQVLEALELHTHMRATYNEDAPGRERRLPYRDSGLWWRADTRIRVPGEVRTPKYIHIVKDVGCFCEHDCCGHCCGLSYNIYTLDSGLVAVVTHASYNY